MPLADADAAAARVVKPARPALPSHFTSRASSPGSAPHRAVSVSRWARGQQVESTATTRVRVQQGRNLHSACEKTGGYLLCSRRRYAPLLRAGRMQISPCCTHAAGAAAASAASASSAPSVCQLWPLYRSASVKPAPPHDSRCRRAPSWTRCSTCACNKDGSCFCGQCQKSVSPIPGHGTSAALLHAHVAISPSSEPGSRTAVIVTGSSARPGRLASPLVLIRCLRAALASLF